MLALGHARNCRLIITAPSIDERNIVMTVSASVCVCVCHTIRYDTIRDAILTCARKLSGLSGLQSLSPIKTDSRCVVI